MVVIPPIHNTCQRRGLNEHGVDDRRATGGEPAPAVGLVPELEIDERDHAQGHERREQPRGGAPHQHAEGDRADRQDHGHGHVSGDAPVDGPVHAVESNRGAHQQGGRPHRSHRGGNHRGREVTPATILRVRRAALEQLVEAVATRTGHVAVHADDGQTAHRVDHEREKPSGAPPPTLEARDGHQEENAEADARVKPRAVGELAGLDWPQRAGDRAPGRLGGRSDRRRAAVPRSLDGSGPASSEEHHAGPGPHGHEQRDDVLAGQHAEQAGGDQQGRHRRRVPLGDHVATSTRSLPVRTR